jgi:O-antigen biosynthesis protein
MPLTSRAPTNDSVTAPVDVALQSLLHNDLDAMFRNADKIGQPSDWIEHIPFAYWLIHTITPQTLVELGRPASSSYAAFCQAVQDEGLETRCYAVECPQKGEDAPQTAEPTPSSTDYSAFSQTFRCTFDEAALRFADSSIDLLHIDGIQSYDAGRDVFKKWLPKLSARGVVLLHHTNDLHGDAGIWRLWNDVASRWPCFEFLHGRGLGILCVGADVPPSVQALLSIKNDVARIRARFTYLGQRWAMESRARILAEEIAYHRDRAHHARGEAEAYRRHVGQMDGKLSTAKQALDKALNEVLDLRTEVRQFDTVQREREGQFRILARDRNRAVKQIAQLTADLEYQRQQTVTLAAAQAENERQLFELYRSSSWRITGPIRGLAARHPTAIRAIRTLINRHPGFRRFAIGIQATSADIAAAYRSYVRIRRVQLTRLYSALGRGKPASHRQDRCHYVVLHRRHDRLAPRT